MPISIATLTSVSIHAPAKGATDNLQTVADRKKRFNPRSREGSDQ